MGRRTKAAGGLASGKGSSTANRPEPMTRLEARMLMSATMPAALGPQPSHPLAYFTPATGVPLNATPTATPRGYVPPPKQVVSRIVVNQTGLSLAGGTSFQMTATAYDQTGKLITVPPMFTWSMFRGGAGGTVTSNGIFTAPATATGSSTLQVLAGVATATVTVTDTTAGVLTGDADVGAPTLSGHFFSNGSIYTVSGSGSDIWNTSDQFNFASAPMTGDGIVEARITSVGNTDPWAKAGVMARNTLDGGSQDVYVIETPAGIVQMLDRTATNAAATTIGQSPSGLTTTGMWVKLVRMGNSFTGYYATDGTTWTQLGTATTIGLNAAVTVGLVASSHNTNTISTSTFDNVQLMTQPTTGIYRLGTKVQPGMSLDIIGFNNANETGVQLFNANYTSNQQWLVQEQGDGTYKIYAYSGANSLQMLDLTNGSAANGTLVNTYTDNGNSAQRWIFVPVGGGYYRIVPKNGENTLQTLDMQNGNSATTGSRADIFGYWGGLNQQFSLLAPGTLQTLSSPKKGLAGNLYQSAAIHNAWGYDWGTGGASQVPSGVEYDPMAWGYYGNGNNSFSNFISGLANGGAKEIMGFNEPDSTSQSNVSVSDALYAWGLMQSASNGVPLLSAAAVHADDSWMQSFMSGAAADGYRVDAVAIHWYGGNDPTGFINYVNYIHSLYNKPVWITEFCPADWSGNGGITVAQATSFMQTVVPQLESMSFVQRFSWFSAGTGDADLGQGALFNNDGSLTSLGQLYSRL